MASAVVEIRWDDLALEWLEAVAGLLGAVREADPVLVADSIAEAADRVDDVIFRGAMRPHRRRP